MEELNTSGITDLESVIESVIDSDAPVQQTFINTYVDRKMAGQSLVQTHIHHQVFMAKANYYPPDTEDIQGISKVRDLHLIWHANDVRDDIMEGSDLSRGFRESYFPNDTRLLDVRRSIFKEFDRRASYIFAGNVMVEDEDHMEYMCTHS